MENNLLNFIETINGSKNENPDEKICFGCSPHQTDYYLEESYIKDKVFPSKHLTLDKIRVQPRNYLIFEDCKFKTLEIRNINGQGVKLVNCKIGELLLKGSVGRIEINSGFINKIQVLPGIIKILVIRGNNEEIICKTADLSSNYIYTLQIFDVRIDNLVISRSNNEQRRLEIMDLSVDTLKLLSIRYGNGIKLNNIKPVCKGKSIIEIENSDLKDLRFQNCDFSKFKYLLVKNSILEEIISEYVIWFKKIIKEDGNEDFLSYRQLKGTVIKQNDSISAAYLKSKELNAYLNSLKGLKNFNERLLLYLNKISNNHGLSWTRGVIFTGITALIFFIIYKFTLDDQLFNWNFNYSFKETVNAFNNGLDEFFKFVSTFPKLKIEDSSESWQTNLVVLLSRIFIGYGVYQTISSFRKYGNK